MTIVYEFECDVFGWSLPAAFYFESNWKLVTPTEMWCTPVLVFGLLCFKWRFYLKTRRRSCTGPDQSVPQREVEAREP